MAVLVKTISQSDLVDKSYRQKVLSFYADRAFCLVEEMLSKPDISAEDRKTLENIKGILLPRLVTYEEQAEKKLIYSIGIAPHSTAFYLTPSGVEEIQIGMLRSEFIASRKDGRELRFKPGLVGYRIFQSRGEAEQKLPKYLDKIRRTRLVYR